MEVKIKFKNEFKNINTKVKLKINYRTFYVYENIMDKSFDSNNITLTSIVDLFYSAITARLMRKGEDILTYNEFNDWLDDQDNADLMITEFTNFLIGHVTVTNELSEKVDIKKEEEADIAEQMAKGSKKN